MSVSVVPLIGKRTLLLVATLLVSTGLAACDDDTSDRVEETVESVGEQAEDAAGSAGARAAAEAMRAALEAENLDANQTARDVAVLQEAVADLPGEPEVTGIQDADGDGKDDDGKVEAIVGDQRACLTVEDNGEISVSGEAC
jgi:hypothetical protein